MDITNFDLPAFFDPSAERGISTAQQIDDDVRSTSDERRWFSVPLSIDQHPSNPPPSTATPRQQAAPINGNDDNNDDNDDNDKMDDWIFCCKSSQIDRR